MGGIEETLPKRKSPEISDPDQVTDCGKAVSIISLIYLVSKYVIFTLRVFFFTSCFVHQIWKLRIYNNSKINYMEPLRWLDPILKKNLHNNVFLNIKTFFQIRCNDVKRFLRCNKYLNTKFMEKNVLIFFFISNDHRLWQIQVYHRCIKEK